MENSSSPATSLPTTNYECWTGSVYLRGHYRQEPGRPPGLETSTLPLIWCMIYVGRSVSSLFQNRPVPAWAQLRTPALHGELLFPKRSNSVLTWGPFTTLPLRWMNSPDLLSKGRRRAAWGSLREGYYFYSHSAWCILTGCINPGSPDRTPALGFANLEKQPDQVCNPGLSLHTQLTVFSPPMHHWCCCCLGTTWNVSPWSPSRTPRSAARWQWRGRHEAASPLQ